jgi:Domain of unknown function (DUF932)
MTNTDFLQQYAPAALASEPRVGLSNQYSFLSTREVLDALEADGWGIVDAIQRPSRRGGLDRHAKHQVILADRRQLTGRYSWTSELPRILITNSHDGNAAYRMRAGLFVRACSNGLEISDGLVQAVAIRHYRRTTEEVVATAQAFRANADLIGEHVEQFKATELSPAAACEFVRQAISLRHDEHHVVAIEDLLKPQRDEDAGSTLWKTFNRAQEWLLKGGYPVYRQLPNDWACQKARAIRSIDDSTRLNTQLWALAEQFSLN